MSAKKKRTVVTLHRVFSRAGADCSVVVYPEGQRKFHAWNLEYPAKWDLAQATLEQVIDDAQPYIGAGLYAVIGELALPYLKASFYLTYKGKHVCLGVYKVVMGTRLGERDKARILNEWNGQTAKISLLLGNDWQLPLWQTNVSPPPLTTEPPP